MDITAGLFSSVQFAHLIEMARIIGGHESDPDRGSDRGSDCDREADPDCEPVREPDHEPDRGSDHVREPDCEPNRGSDREPGLEFDCGSDDETDRGTSHETDRGTSHEANRGSNHGTGHEAEAAADSVAAGPQTTGWAGTRASSNSVRAIKSSRQWKNRQMASQFDMRALRVPNALYAAETRLLCDAVRSDTTPEACAQWTQDYEIALEYFTLLGPPADIATRHRGLPVWLWWCRNEELLVRGLLSNAQCEQMRSVPDRHGLSVANRRWGYRMSLLRDFVIAAGRMPSLGEKTADGVEIGEIAAKIICGTRGLSGPYRALIAELQSHIAQVAQDEQDEQVVRPHNPTRRSARPALPTRKSRRSGALRTFARRG